MKEAEAMWYLANIQPATVEELQEVSGQKENSIRTVLNNLRGHGFIHHRERIVDNAYANPYEWAIRTMDGEIE